MDPLLGTKSAKNLKNRKHKKIIDILYGSHSNPFSDNVPHFWERKFVAWTCAQVKSFYHSLLRIAGFLTLDIFLKQSNNALAQDLNIIYIYIWYIIPIPIYCWLNHNVCIFNMVQLHKKVQKSDILVCLKIMFPRIEQLPSTNFR